MVQLDLDISKIIVLYKNYNLTKENFEEYIKSFSKDELVSFVIESNTINEDSMSIDKDMEGFYSND